MSRRLMIPCLTGLVVIAACLIRERLVEAQAQVAIRWPDPRYRSLQEAIDAAPDGSTVWISAGPYPLREPVRIHGRTLLLRGEGSGRRRGEPVTHLMGPPPRPVLDARGRVILRPVHARGLIEVEGGRVRIAHLRLSGFDAGIAARGTGRSVTLRVRDLVITGTGRGILGLAPGLAQLSDSMIQNTLWHGVAAAPAAEDPAPAAWTLHRVVCSASGGAGVFVEGAHFAVEGLDVDGARGGLIARRPTGGWVAGSTFPPGEGTGIGIFQPQGDVVIRGSAIHGSDPGPAPAARGAPTRRITPCRDAGVAGCGGRMVLGDTSIAWSRSRVDGRCLSGSYGAAPLPPLSEIEP